MVKLAVLVLAGLACVLVAECSEEIEALWKEKMKEHMCGEKDPESFMKCAEILPKEVHDIMQKESETENNKDALIKMCSDEEIGQKVCDALKDKHELFPDEISNSLHECLKALE